MFEAAGLSRELLEAMVVRVDLDDYFS